MMSFYIDDSSGVQSGVADSNLSAYNMWCNNCKCYGGKALFPYGLEKKIVSSRDLIRT